MLQLSAAKKWLYATLLGVILISCDASHTHGFLVIRGIWLLDVSSFTLLSLMLMLLFHFILMGKRWLTVQSICLFKKKSILFAQQNQNFIEKFFDIFVPPKHKTLPFSLTIGMSSFLLNHNCFSQPRQFWSFHNIWIKAYPVLWSPILAQFIIQLWFRESDLYMVDICKLHTHTPTDNTVQLINRYFIQSCSAGVKFTD